MPTFKFQYTPPGATYATDVYITATTLANAQAHMAAFVPTGSGGTVDSGVAWVATVPADAGDLALKAPINNPTFTGTVAGVTKAMVGLGNADNTSDVNKPVSTAQAAADAAVLASASAYSDALVVGLWDDRGNLDASGGAYPSTGGSGTAGAILKGDIFTVSVAGTLPTGQVVEIGDSVRAKIDTPGNTQANWAILQNNIGYVAENAANKTATVVGNEASTTLYLSVKGYYDYLIGMVWLTAQIWGTWIVGLTGKTTPVDADSIVISDSADTNTAKKVSLTNFKAFLKTPVARNRSLIGLAFNTARTPSATQDIEVTATVILDCDDGQTSTVIFEVDNSGGGTFTTIGSVSNFLNAISSTLGADGTDIDRHCVTFTVPVGSQYRITNSGTGTETLSTVYELVV